MSKKYEILKMKAGKYDKVKIKLPLIFDLPARIAIVGKSELSGKSNLVCNLMLRTKYYKDQFKPENIFIVCASSDLDEKFRILKKELDIPDMNIMKKYNEQKLDDLYEVIREEQLERMEKKEAMEHYCFIFDDVSYDGSLKKYRYGVISKLASNGRHLLITTILTAQKYSDISTSFRENATGIILYSCTNAQLDTIWTDHGLIDRKSFYKMFRENTNKPYSFLVINYSNPPNERFLNDNFEPLDLDKYEKKKK